MSHITIVSDIAITDLDILEEAANRLGYHMKKGTSIRYHGGTQNTAEYIIEVPGTDWNIGVVKQKDGSYKLVGDTYGDRGRKVAEAVKKIAQLYTAEATASAARKQGYSVMEEYLAGQGSYHIQVIVED